MVLYAHLFVFALGYNVLTTSHLTPTMLSVLKSVQHNAKHAGRQSDFRLNSFGPNSVRGWSENRKKVGLKLTDAELNFLEQVYQSLDPYNVDMNAIANPQRQRISIAPVSQCINT